ncbi:beta-N-acetylglucosaminidase domain-containing protein, partial [Olsenella sp. An290]|uniref:beta-N-acetylglucosaminidase domain-containing protein n=1 Tax=Olsenella sp. An290 TaxID=1965625 RepID=UPI00117DEC02
MRLDREGMGRDMAPSWRRRAAVGALAVSAALVGALGALARPALADEVTYQLYPTPQDMVYGDASIALGETADVLVEDGIDADTVARLEEALALKDIASESYDSVDALPADGDTDVLVGVKDSGDAVDAYVDELVGEGALDLADDLFSKTDAYLLAVIPAESGSDGKIVVLGKDTDAAFYGLTSLYQIFQEETGDELREFTLSDWADVVSRGFIEGYYGNPWSQEDREDLMEWGGYHKLNVYVYAPKDDNNHRLQWRHMYTDEELAKISALAEAGNKSKCRFVYALLPFYAPGEIDGNTEESLGVDVDEKFDLVNNYDEDLKVLKARYLQVIDAGVRQIALLADDAKDQGGQNYLRLLKDLTAWLEDLQKETNDDGTLKYPGLKTTIPYVGAQWTYTGTGEAWYKDAPQSVQFVVTGGQTFGSVNADFIGKVQTATGRNPFMWINWPCTDPLPNYLTMGGHNTFLEAGVEPGSVDGIMLNPMQQSEPSKQGIFMVSDYAWNIWDSEERANQTWQDSFSFMEGNTPVESEASDALRELSMHMRMSTAGTTGATNPTPDYSASVPGQDRLFSFWKNEESVDYTGETDPAGVMDALKEAVQSGSVTADDLEAARPTYQSIVDAANTYEESHVNERMWTQVEPFVKALRDKAQASLDYLDVIEAGLALDTTAAQTALDKAEATYEQSCSYTYNQLGTNYEARAGHEHVEPTLSALRSYATDLVSASSDIPVSSMTFRAGSEVEDKNAGATEGKVGFAFDDNTSTFWGTAWDTSSVTVDDLWVEMSFEEPTAVSALRYLPRQTTGDPVSTGSCNGTVTEYQVLYSNDGETWEVAAAGEWEDYTNKDWRVAKFDAPVTATHFRLKAVHSFAAGGNDTGMSAAEVRLVAAPTLELDALRAAIESAEALSEPAYTPESWAELEGALAAARDALTGALNQAAVDNAVAKLEAAIAGLDGAVPEGGKYTEATPFAFPAETDGTTVLEFEYGELVNDPSNDNGWPLTTLDMYGVTLVDALNHGDAVKVPFTAAKAGTYRVTLSYASGSPTNALSWSDEAGIVQAGSTEAGASDAAAELHTVTFDMTLAKAGDSTLVFGSPEGASAPRLDKLTITLVEPTDPEPEPEVNYDDLKAAISAAEALTESDYTPSTWAGVASALDAAREALSSEDQATVDAAAEALDAARDALVERADTTALEASIAAAEAADTEGKTAESVAALEEALDAAR